MTAHKSGDPTTLNRLYGRSKGKALRAGQQALVDTLLPQIAVPDEGPVTAERLFGDRGLEGVSLREVGVAAGQRNNYATQQHFGDRDALIAAIYEYRAARLNDRRSTVVAELQKAGRLVLMLLGAHSVYDRDYVERCVRSLLRSGADNVGGVLRIVPRDDTLMGAAIALASGSGFGSGDAYTKRGARSPRLVDTVFGGCYRREVFDRVGLFDERLARSQDFDFNLRLRRAGGKILLDPNRRRVHGDIADRRRTLRVGILRLRVAAGGQHQRAGNRNHMVHSRPRHRRRSSSRCWIEEFAGR